VSVALTRSAKNSAGKGTAAPVYRRSRQRERILQLLQSTGTHPTAAWLFERMKKDFPHLSLGTVYRNLGILTEQGRVRRISAGSSFDRLDANTSPHAHFICDRCGAIIDLDEPDVGLGQDVGQGLGLVVERRELRLYGLCGRCAAKT